MSYIKYNNSSEVEESKKFRKNFLDSFTMRGKLCFYSDFCL